MPWWLVVAIAVAALVVCDRLLLAAERRGWIYWRTSPPRRAGVGHALQNIGAIFRPSVHHVVEQRAAVETDEDDDGEPPNR